MLHPEDFICPICGHVLSSRHAFRNHVAKNHESSPQRKVNSDQGSVLICRFAAILAILIGAIVLWTGTQGKTTQTKYSRITQGLNWKAACIERGELPNLGAELSNMWRINWENVSVVHGSPHIEMATPMPNAIEVFNWNTQSGTTISGFCGNNSLLNTGPKREIVILWHCSTESAPTSPDCYVSRNSFSSVCEIENKFLSSHWRSEIWHIFRFGEYGAEVSTIKSYESPLLHSVFSLLLFGRYSPVVHFRELFIHSAPLQEGRSELAQTNRNERGSQSNHPFFRFPYAFLKCLYILVHLLVSYGLCLRGTWLIMRNNDLRKRSFLFGWGLYIAAGVVVTHGFIVVQKCIDGLS